MEKEISGDDFLNDLAERLFRFAADVIKFLGTLANVPESKIIKYQLARSAGSNGVNWLRLIKASGLSCNYKERQINQ